MFSTIMMLAFSFLSIVWTLPLILGGIVGLKLYKVSTRHLVMLALKKLPKRSTIISEDNPRGWIWGWPYIGYVSELGSANSCSNVELYIYTTKAYYDQMVNQDQHKNSVEKSMINLWGRSGNFFWLKYNKRQIDVNKFNCRDNQKQTVEQIIECYKEKENVVAYIHGEQGAGKSIVPILIAKDLKGSICIDFNPTDPGDNLELVYNSICPSKENPLVLVFEEVDIMITKIHNGMIKKHKSVPTSVLDKTGFNTMLDWIDRGLYPNLILIMTSNKSPDYVDSLDRSYLREGRVDLKIKLDCIE